MYVFLRCTLLLVSALLLACSSKEEASVPTIAVAPPVELAIVADAVYTNGKIYTVNEAQPWANALALKDGEFIAVGSVDEIEAFVGKDTAITDLGGRLLLPGFIDVHVHPLGVATGWANLKITDPTNVEAILASVKAYAEANPDAEMIRGEPWNLGVFPNDSPRKELLDEIAPDIPVYFVSQTGHSGWANSKALEMAGITGETPITATFIFDTDSETGEPSGTVREFGMGAIEQILPATPTERYAPVLGDILREFNRYGFTTLKPAEGEKPWLEGAVHLESQGGLTTRLFPAWHWRTHYSTAVPEAEDDLIANWEKYKTDLIYPRYVKVFYDGGPDSYTALLLEDYVGRPGFKGQSNRTREEFIEVFSKFNAEGMGLLVHVLGDGGARELAEVFAEVRKRNGDNGNHLHFSHAWMADQVAFEGLAQLSDACVDFSPVLSYPAEEIIGSFVPPLGNERYQKFFNVRAAIESGVSVGFGSDWASALIPEPNAFHQMQAWITRVDPQDPASGALNPDQGIKLEQAVRGFTQGGADCLGFGWEDRLGSIEVGKLADFVVVDRNIFEKPIEKLHQTQVDLTVMNGELVYDRRD
jgi:predicted amidohydrolase YtcJ